MTSPLPDIEEILRVISKHPYVSLIDGKDAYEQIRVKSADIHKMIFNTPDGTMVSLVMQQGDCNARATYQTLMNSIFSDYIGVFIYIYLDDMAIFSLTMEDHITHCKLIIDQLKKEQFYISKGKMQFFVKELHLLGHVIKDGGIVMDPAKVDWIEN